MQESEEREILRVPSRSGKPVAKMEGGGSATGNRGLRNCAELCKRTHGSEPLEEK